MLYSPLIIVLVSISLNQQLIELFEMLCRITDIAKQVKTEVAKREKKLQEKAKLIEESTKRPPKKIGKYR